MAIGILRDAHCFLGAYNITGVQSEMTLNASNDILDSTTFPQLTREHLPGLRDTEASGTGYLPFGDNLGTSGTFDTATDLADWTPAVSTVALSAAAPQAGANSCEWTATGAGTKTITATIKLKANRSYRAVFYGKDGTNAGQTVRLRIDQAGGDSMRSEDLTTAAGWASKTLDFTISSDGDYEVSLRWTDATATNTIFVDSVSVYEVIDKALYNNLSTAGTPITIAPNGSTIGSLAYFFKSTQSEYAPGGSIGELLGFSWAAGANNRLLRGNVLESARVSGSSTSVEQGNGAVLTGQSLYAALHVLSWGGDAATTLDVLVQSDATGFGSPTTKITFAQATGITSEYATPVSGPIADDFWRVSYTTAGAGEDFVFIVVMAIM